MSFANESLPSAPENSEKGSEIDSEALKAFIRQFDGWRKAKGYQRTFLWTDLLKQRDALGDL